MANKYTTKINMNDGRRKGMPGKRAQVSRMEMAARNRPRAQFAALKKYRLSKSARQKLQKVGLLLLGLVLIVGIFGGIWFFSYLQKLNEELPPVENPFQDKELTSVIYDRNGTQLYKLFNQFNRDPVDITEIPERVKWAFLSAEDIDFYNHQGFDPAAILRCGIRYVTSTGGSTCGGSTITQQLVKITTNQNQLALERKIRELLFAMKIEQAYSKDQILQMYLTVAPFGSTIYGITTASRFYFGKEPKDLTLAEAAILASIIQNPVQLAPTIGTNTEVNQKRVKDRQMYVLGQMENYMNKINTQTRTNLDNPELEDVLTVEMIEAAKSEEIHYRAPIFTEKKAGNFVDYVMEQLQAGNYKNGQEPFTLTELQTGGYKIYTTLDYDLQQIAEQTVAEAAGTYGSTYEFSNAALMTTQPSTGEILVMVGSKNYYGKSEPEGCKGLECRFDPQVNVLANPRSPGSSTKPYGTYEAYRQGLMFSGSVLPDVPIDVGGGYTIKNWNGTFMGVSPQTTAGEMLRISRNLTAIAVLRAIGIPKFLEVVRSFGYTTFGDDSQYGPSVILGGSGVIGIEHAQAYGVFANGGDFVRSQVITKIVDRTGQTVYEYHPQRTRIADERAVYMLNQTLLNNHVLSWDGRDIAAKSGTSEDSTDAWIVMWSPDFVSVAWIGNNNSATMNFNAFGESAVAPWLKNYMRQVGDTDYFANASEFPRPGGIVEGGGCSGSANECIGSFQGLTSGFMMDDVKPPADVTYTKIRVCKDQKERLARPIDETTGNAEDAIAVYYKMVAPEYQVFLDNYMMDQATQGKGMPNGGPKDYCDKNRGGFVPLNVTIGGDATPYTVAVSGNAYASSGTVTKVNFYFDTTVADNSKLLGSVNTTLAFSQTFNIPATYNNDQGTYTLLGEIIQSDGGKVTSTVTVTLNSPANNLSVVSVPASPSPLTFTYNPALPATNTKRIAVSYTGGGSIGTATMIVSKNGADVSVLTLNSSNSYGYDWAFTNPGAGKTDTYVFRATAGKGSTGNLTATQFTVVVNGV